MKNINTLIACIEETSPRSAWDKGVKIYALELLEDLREGIAGGYYDDAAVLVLSALTEALLNGARSWTQYSWGGSSLIYDGDIAERLCTPSELKRKKGGELRPNSREEWLDTQARALHQASQLIRRHADRIAREEARAC